MWFVLNFRNQTQKTNQHVRFQFSSHFLSYGYYFHSLILSSPSPMLFWLPIRNYCFLFKSMRFQFFSINKQMVLTNELLNLLHVRLIKKVDYRQNQAQVTSWISIDYNILETETNKKLLKVELEDYLNNSEYVYALVLIFSIRLMDS